MANLNILAWLIAVVSLALMAFGLGWLAWPLLGATVLIAFVPIINKPVFNESTDDTRTRRIVAVFAIAFAAVPVVQPHVAALARWNRQRLETRRCAPLFPKAREAAASLSAPALAFHAQFGVWPTLDVNGLAPLIDAKGRVLKLPVGADAALAASDPFAKGAAGAVRLVALGDRGVLVVSAGPNGVFDLPPAAEVAPMDPAPAAPLAMLAATGIEWRRLGWQTGKSPLEPGDVLTYIDDKGQTEAGEDALATLIAAWKAVEAESPGLPTTVGGPIADADGVAARRLYDKGQFLAALAAASRARRWRPPYPAQWKTPGLSSIDRTRGMAFYELGHFRNAADSLLEYTTLNGGDAEAQFYLGAALWRGGDPKQARYHFAAAIQVEPTAAVVPAAMAAFAATDRGAEPALPPARGIGE